MGVELKAESLEFDSLSSDAELAWKTFVRLSKRRGHGAGGPEPISWEAIFAYIDHCLDFLDEDEVEDLLYLLDCLDNSYLEHKGKELEKRTRKPPREAPKAVP